MFFKNIFSSGKRREVPVGVFLGQTGTGKTTLLNKICGTKYEAGWSETSKTRHLFKNPNNVGKGAFELLDTPGTDSSQETYKHAVLLKHALTTSEVNTVFVIVKYENRHNKIVANFINVQAPVYKYESKIVVMISHWDLSTNPNEEEVSIRKNLEKNCAGVIFYSQNDSSQKLADSMFSFLKKMKRGKLEIPDEEFFMTFNIYQIKISMIKDYDRYQKDLLRLESEFKKLSLSIEMSGEEKDEFIHSLIVSFKIESETLLSNFEERHRDEMNGMDYYVSYIHFQKECVQINDMFAKQMSQLMSYDLNDKQDPRNLIKRCPNPSCGLIWFKTEGCAGATSCGSRVSVFFDILKKGSLKFEFIRKDDGSFKWVKRKMAPVQKDQSQRNSQGQGKGCGTKFVWSELPKLEDEKLLELFQAKTIEEVKQRLTRKDFIQQKRIYDETIDKTIYSTPPS